MPSPPTALPPPPSFCSTAPQAFFRPDRVLSPAGARRWLSRLAPLQRPPPPGLRPLQQSSTTAGLIGRVDYTPVSYLSLIRLRVSARYSDDGCYFWQVLLRSPWPVR